VGPADGNREMADGSQPADGGRRATDATQVEMAQAMTALRVQRPDLTFDVRWHASLPSTMDVVAAAADAGAAAGLVVVADEQTEGRGRRGHTWCSPPGAGLYLSYLHRPRGSVELVTLAAGVAVREAIVRSCGLAPHLKWPNDLLVGSRKLAGLLAEGARVGTVDAAVTIGVGLNIEPVAYPPDVAARATCLAREIAGAVDRSALLAAIIEQLADTLARLDAGGGGDILQAWRAASPLSTGTPVAWSDGILPRRGITAGVDTTGALLVETAAGVERVIAGELQWTLPDSEPCD
jgi:BirA family transcriptional regulator, biotin operon repressor / biotin---[acetyl-CoA-carboxylase] ligase